MNKLINTFKSFSRSNLYIQLNSKKNQLEMVKRMAKTSRSIAQVYVYVYPHLFSGGVHLLELELER